MRNILIGCFALALALPAAAADVENLMAAGVSYNPQASPKVAGSALVANSAGDGTYLLTMFDALPTTVAPYVVTSQVTTGVAKRVISIKGAPIYVPTAAGISWTGTNVGWSWTTGALASIRIRDQWYALPNVRVLKSSIGNGSGYIPIIGIMFGWGK